jgi:mRNA-degrading endonuclease HigB of HigAB toxin-antitoxin module
MRLIGRERLNCLKGQSEALDKWLVSWLSELAHAQWAQAGELLNQFPTARQLQQGLFAFRVGTGTYEIEVQIAFPQGIALITAFKNFRQ